VVFRKDSGKLVKYAQYNNDFSQVNDILDKPLDIPLDLAKLMAPDLRDSSAPRDAYFYAWGILQDQWPEAETTIAQDPMYAHIYALNIIKDRWPEAEPTIAQDPMYAYLYAANVIQGRWPEAEATIASSGFADYYARKVLGLDREQAKHWRKTQT